MAAQEYVSREPALVLKVRAGFPEGVTFELRSEGLSKSYCVNQGREQGSVQWDSTWVRLGG